MCEFIFPFSNVDHINDIFSDEPLPYEYFNALTSMKEIFSDNSNNPLNFSDNELNLDSIPETEYFMGPEYLDSMRSTKFSMLCCNINSISRNLDYFLCSCCDDSFQPSVLAFCETKLCPDIESIIRLNINSCFQQ